MGARRVDHGLVESLVVIDNGGALSPADGHYQAMAARSQH
ncbi:hypothetical protein BN903_106 [Halorubrum sp. AJ67]|nr:hypothetical protein BN903_106 [Halorubrum sp. AJ67]